MQPAGANPGIYPVRFPGPREFLAEWERSLSKGGLFVDTQAPAPFGTTVRVALELPNGGGTVPILGQVAFVIPPNAPQAKRPGMGVRFALDPQTEQAVRTFVHQLSRGSNAGRVLVVDDDALILAQIKDLLEATGFQVKTVPHAIKALDVLKFEAFDVILSDLNMPRMDGFEFRDNLQQDPKTRDVPFILITSTTDDETRQTAKRLGAKAFIAKPISPEPLLSVLRSAIAEYAASAANAAPARQEDRKSSTAAVRERRIVEIAYRKMKALGMDVRFTADEKGVGGRVLFQRVNLVNAFTQQRITEARVRNVEHDRIRFTAPPHLTNLPDVPILDLADANAFEKAVAAAYAARAESQARAKGLFDKFRMRSELDEPGFRVVSRVKIGMDEVTFSVIDAKTILLESLNGRHFGSMMGEGARRIDISEATSGVDVELELATVLRQYRPELERLAKEAERAAAEEKKQWLETPELTAAPRAAAGPAAEPSRAMFAKPGEFRLDQDDAPPPSAPPPPVAPAPQAAPPPHAAPAPAEPEELELTELEPEPAPEPEPEPAAVDASALEMLDARAIDLGGSAEPLDLAEADVQELELAPAEPAADAPADAAGDDPFAAPEPAPEAVPPPAPDAAADADPFASYAADAAPEPEHTPMPPPEPTPMPAPIAPIEEPAAAPPPGDEVVLVCATCGSSYALGDEVEDERLLTSCAACIAAGNALS